jgi:uncharacterized membrane protein YqjE
MATQDQRTVSQLVSDAVDQFTKLIRNEMAIARAELSARASEAMTGLGLLVGGAVLLIPALVLLLLALAAWLNEFGLPLSLSNLIAALVGILVSGVLAYLGKQRLSPENLTPKHTIRELERDAAIVGKR